MGCVVFSCFRNGLSNKVRVSRGYSTLPYWLMNDAAVQGFLEHLRLRLRACPTFYFVIIITFCFKATLCFHFSCPCCPVCEGMLIRSGRSTVTAIPPQESSIAKHSPAMITVWARALIRTGIMAIPWTPWIPILLCHLGSLPSAVCPPVGPSVRLSAPSLGFDSLTQKSNSYPIRTVP